MGEDMTCLLYTLCLAFGASVVYGAVLAMTANQRPAAGNVGTLARLNNQLMERI